MLPLWRDEVGIYIGPSKVVLARMRRGIRPKCVAETGLSLDKKEPGGWQLACGTLTGLLDDEQWQNANARIVISDHWARYAVLPWSTDISNDSERTAHARLILSNTYGDLADEWTICLTDNRPFVPAIVSAIPSELLQHLKDILQARKLRLVSVQANTIVSFNAWRNHLADQSSWFAAVDDGSLVAMHLTEGHCDQVQSVRISGDWLVELRRIQTMGRLTRTGAHDCSSYVDAPDSMKPDCENHGAAIEWLQSDEEAGDVASKVTLAKGMYS